MLSLTSRFWAWMPSIGSSSTVFWWKNSWHSPVTILLSTHLISEVENLIDHTIILREGRILRNAPTEELLTSAYTLSGPAGLVEQYTEGKQILTSHSLGGLKTVTLQEESTEPLPAGLERSSMRLQDYFISLQEAEDGTAERKDANHVYES